jgi:hypothetical protein
VILQKGCFTFHPPGKPTLTRNVTNSLRSFQIPKGSKSEIKKELFVLGIDEFTIYGDLDGLAVRLKFAYDVR